MHVHWGMTDSTSTCSNSMGTDWIFTKLTGDVDGTMVIAWCRCESGERPLGEGGRGKKISGELIRATE